MSDYNFYVALVETLGNLAKLVSVLCILF